MQKNDIIEVMISDYGNDGEGIGKLNNFPFFIKGAIPGETVTAKIIKLKKNLGYARLVSVDQVSPNRAEPVCPVASRCGGCTLQHLSYDEELRLKENKVKNCLLRIGGIAGNVLQTAMEPICGMENPLRYRNKAQYPVGRRKAGPEAAREISAGFFAGHTHDIIPNDDCVLSPIEFSRIVKTVIGFMNDYKIPPYDEETGKGLIRHILLRKGFSTGELMVCLICSSPALPHRDDLIERLNSAAGIVSICLNINPEKTNVILGRETRLLYGRPYIEDCLGSLRFQISAASFYQVNPLQTIKLYETVLSYADLKGTETVWDICCGIGTISLFAARRLLELKPSLWAESTPGEVIGLEISEEAITDAAENAKINNIDNVRFISAAAENYIPDFVRKHPEAHADIAIMDPPRKGMEESVLEAVIQMSPSKIIYVSCDPATLARDLKFLLSKGYKLMRCRPFDNFCRTSHIETVCLLSNRKPDARVKIDVDLEDYYRIKDEQKKNKASE